MDSNLPDPLLIAGVMIAAGLLPFFALMISSYTKIVVVLGLVRQALGTQQVPSTLVLNGIAIIVSVFIMAPVFGQGWDNLAARHPGSQFGKSFADLMVIAGAMEAPVKGFLEGSIDEHSRQFFLRAARQVWPKERAARLAKDDLLVLIPSFTVSELTAAFQIGFVLYLAFVVVDLVVANILLALGMYMTSPTLISIPFKLLLFVALDGWSHLIEGLVLTYRKY
jgi:type III secretion protein R